MYNKETKAWAIAVNPPTSYALNQIVDALIENNNMNITKNYTVYYDGKKFNRHSNGLLELEVEDFDDYGFEDPLDYCGYILQCYQENWLLDYPEKFAEKITMYGGEVPYSDLPGKSVPKTVDFISKANMEDLDCMGV